MIKSEPNKMENHSKIESKQWPYYPFWTPYLRFIVTSLERITSIEQDRQLNLNKIDHR